MTENKININRKKLSSTEVGERENLDGILNKHQSITKRPAYKQKKLYFLLFLILLIVVIIYYSEKETKTNKEGAKIENTN